MSFLQLQARAERERRRRNGKGKQQLSFREFVNRVNPQFKWYKHCEILAERLQEIADGDRNRLMIFLPPRHGKTEIISRLFSAYYLYRYPERWVGLNSYGASLSYTFSRNARDYYRRFGGQLKSDAAGVEHWETTEGGGLWAAGVGGAITGKGFHLGIIDDPIKNAEEADSETIREKHKDWYASTFYTRKEPDAAIIVIQTRWHEEDLAGWLLEEEHGDEPEEWHVVSFEAIKTGDEPDVPDTCTLEADWRKVGEALWPERYDVPKLTKIKARLGTHWWSALYNQRPQPRAGNKFKRYWFDTVRAVPYEAKRVRYWDLAATAGSGAMTAGVLLAFAAGIDYVEDVAMGQWSTAERNAIIKETAEQDAERYHNSVRIWIEEEPGSSGKEAAEAHVRMLSGYPVRTDKVTGSKEIRADPFAAQAEAKNIKLLKSDWNKRYLDILTSFPSGKYADVVDASSGAFNKLHGGPQATWEDMADLGSVEDFKHWAAI